ncbi:hypothetical protein [Microvirga pudoricolor]|uniref:hypothetical protein n=1 Tax=Microvirga pudoricolor TaxID=2778729 RepID=UPI001951B8DC|nr:hypothetical protein [Microvirga pudoricolor]MBM6594518.1 hypothetical protein [Microvirga pudoricolor]
MTDDEIEAVASAFYAVEHEAGNWQRAPEMLKEAFRMEARVAIAACNEHYLGAQSETFDQHWQVPASAGSRYLH